jgi:hypothetical protein
MTVTLSVEELIYCFYSEGLFEQGLGLKQVYFQDLSDEQMNLIFQAACRSLLSKDYLTYEQRRFTLKKEIARIISCLNGSSFTLKASKFLDDGDQDTMSVHFSEEGTYEHSLRYEGQVHVFRAISSEESYATIGSYLGVSTQEKDEGLVLPLNQSEFESMLTLIDENSDRVADYVRTIGGDTENIQAFASDMVKNKGLMDNILFLEYDKKREPVLLDIIFVVNGERDTWIITRPEEGRYEVRKCNRASLAVLMEKTSRAAAAVLKSV